MISRKELVAGARAPFQSLLACAFVICCANATRGSGFSFEDIDFWVGSGPNQAAFVVDWAEGSTEPPAMAWGYRWDGSATGRDMLLAIVAADDRLFVKLGDNPSNPIRVFGLGYDADNDGEFGLADGTSFNDSGIGFGSAPFFATTAVDADDRYVEGWTFGFWHYGIASSNPYDDGEWLDIQVGMVSRELANGAWDSWAFENSTNPPFDSYAENPIAAPSPFPPGDYDRDGDVDAADYARWKEQFGTAELTADGNGDGVVNAADYTVWRNAISTQPAASSMQPTNVPEPMTISLTVLALVACILVAARWSERKYSPLDRSSLHYTKEKNS